MQLLSLLLIEMTQYLSLGLFGQCCKDGCELTHHLLLGRLQTDLILLQEMRVDVDDTRQVVVVRTHDTRSLTSTAYEKHQ